MPYMKITISGPYVGTDRVTLQELPEDWHDMDQREQNEIEDENWLMAVSDYIDGSVEILEGDIEDDEDY